MEDVVLERNLCFVDTPGYSSGMSKMETIESVLQYIEGQLERSFSSSGEGDAVRLLSGNGGLQVDVVFYMVSRGMEPTTFRTKEATDINSFRDQTRGHRLPPAVISTYQRHYSYLQI